MEIGVVSSVTPKCSIPSSFRRAARGEMPGEISGEMLGDGGPELDKRIFLK